MLTVRKKLEVGSDGLPVRQNGQYARQKLKFLDRYLPWALTATIRKKKRVYVDLFAGPGRNSDGVHEFEGGAIRALTAGGRNERARFTDAVLVNLNPVEHDALTERVAKLCDAGHCLIPRARIRLVLGDSNLLIGDLLRAFHDLDYLMVFADIEAPKQLPFVTLQTLKARHQSVDLYMLFPLDMAIKRLVSYNQRRRHEWAPTLDSFFGTEEWKTLGEELRANPDRRAELSRALTSLYCRQLRTLWDDADSVLDVHLRRKRRLYKMLFAASNDVAQRIRSHVQKSMSDDADTGQGRLL